MISRIAVGTDGSKTAAAAIEVAAEMARRFEAELILLSAFEEAGTAPKDEPDERQWATSTSAQLQAILARLEKELSSDGLACSTLVGEGDAAETLCQLAEACKADVLVIGNKGMHRRLLGSVPNSVTHSAPCSVFVVKTT